jgi:hypothetical protein
MTWMRTLPTSIVLSAVLFGLTPATLTAQEKISDTRVQVITKLELVRLDDVEGHTIAIFENKGYNLKNGSWTLNRGTNDLVKGNGTAQGYTKTHYPDGSTTYSSWEGKATMITVDGKPMSTSSGTWKLLSGTGIWKDREGGGTWKAKGVGEGVSFVEWEGEWRPKR